jgi:hypothetical protein
MMRPVLLCAAIGLCTAIALPDLLPEGGNADIAPQATSEQAAAEIEITAWAERPLFDQSRKPFAGAGTEGDATAAPTGAFAERFEVKGFGRANGSVLAIVVDKASHKAYRLRPGEQLEDWTFASESDGTVTFRSEGGETTSLTLARLP